MAHADKFQRLKLDFADFGRTDDGLEKYLKTFGKEHRNSEKKTVSKLPHIWPKTFSGSQRNCKILQKMKFYVVRIVSFNKVI